MKETVTETSLLRRRSLRYFEKERGTRMFNKKLVFISGKPFWLLPEGSFLAVEQKNGRIVDPVLFRKPDDRWSGSIYGEQGN